MYRDTAWEGCLKKALPLIFLALVASSTLLGQTDWTLDKCLGVARERSPKLQAARNVVRSSEFSQSELLTSRLPQLRIGLNSLYSPVTGQFGYDDVITNRGQIAGQLIVQQSMYDGGVRGLKVDQLETEIEQRNKEYRLSDRDLTYEVRQAFVEVIRAQRENDLQLGNVQQLKDYLELVKRLTKGGIGSSTDLLKTEVQLATAQLALQKAIVAAALDRYALLELLSISPDTSVTFADSLEGLVQTQLDSTGSSVWHPDASLELVVLNMEYRRSLVDIELARHQAWPSVSLVGDAGLLTSGDNLQLAPADRYRAVGYSLGITVDVPVFNWGATDLRVQQNRLASENLRLQSELLYRSLDSESRRLLLLLESARERLRLVRTNRGASEENFLLTKSKYAVGGSLAIEVLSAQQLLTDAKIAELQNLAEIENLKAKLDRLHAE